MEKRVFGRTGTKLSVLAFGCGVVGGLIVRGDPLDQERTVARARARRLLPLVNEGFATNLVEAATRFALSHSAMGTILVGMATPQQFEDALAAVHKGPLPTAALDPLSALLHAFAGEPR